MNASSLSITNEDEIDPHAEIDQLVSNFTHDVGASVRAISDIPRWIADDVAAAGIELPETVMESLQMLIRQSSRFERLMQDLTTYSRAGRVRGDSSADLSAVLQKVLSETESSSGLHISSDVLPYQVGICENDLATLFRAMVSNAGKHNDRTNGKLAISSWVSDGQVAIRFSDDGPGIPKEHQAKIFELLKTLKSRDQVEGSGMGLAICKKICRLYSIDIRVHSTPPDRGTDFDLVFPTEPAE